MQAPGDKSARQLAAPSPDLKHLITAPDPCDLTSLVDEFVGISRAAAVVLSRDAIKDLAVTTCTRSWQPWRATPLPRWCYFVGAITATTAAAVLAGAVTIAAAVLLYGTHFDAGPAAHLTTSGALAILAALALAGLAWAATATALTSFIPTVEAAFPILILTYFPLIIISGVLFAIREPHWLSTLATYLPAQPLIDAVTTAVRHARGAPFLPARDMIVLAAWAVGGLLTAVLTFRWEPRRPAWRRPARTR